MYRRLDWWGLEGDGSDPRDWRPMGVATADAESPGARTAGEAWAREQLDLLLARRFSPPAIARFLAASQRRANTVRAARPALGRQAWTWSAAGAALWLGLAAGGAEPFRSRLRGGLGWWAACAVMLDWHLGMVETPEGRPRPLGAADAVTLARAWLVPVAWADPAAVVVLAAAASDALDGPLARRGESTRIGRDLEGLVDACLSGAALRGAVRRGRLGRAAAAGEGLRLATGIGYAAAVWLGRARPPERRLVRAARATSPVRAAGLVAAGLGRRRAADALVAGGALASVAITARALAAVSPDP